MSASRRFPKSRFQPGIAAMYACTGASPSAFAICGLPPERSFTGLALLVRLAVARDAGDGLDFDFEDFTGFLTGRCRHDMLPRSFRNPGEYDATPIQRSDFSFSILDEPDHLTVSAGQHHDANGVRLGIRRGDGAHVAHANSERSFFCQDLNRARQVVSIPTSIISKRFCQQPLSLGARSGFSGDPLLSAFISGNGLL